MRGDTDRAIILFLNPLIFDTKISRDLEQYYICPVCVSFCFFSRCSLCMFSTLDGVLQGSVAAGLCQRDSGAV